MLPNETSRTPNTGERLAAEWNRLRRRPASLRTADTWNLLPGPVTDLDDVLRAIGFETADTYATSESLRRLVLFAAHDELAGRVVIQRILPGLLATVRRRRRLVGNDAFDLLLSAAWESIRTFNPDRRPACLAAALISDADYLAFRAEHRRRRVEIVPLTEIDQLSDERAPHPADELCALFDEAARAGLADADLLLLRQLIAAPTTIELAAQLSVTPRAIRKRRARITGRLRGLTLAA